VRKSARSSTAWVVPTYGRSLVDVNSAVQALTKLMVHGCGSSCVSQNEAAYVLGQSRPPLRPIPRWSKKTMS
jgi:hypothetical protein